LNEFNQINVKLLIFIQTLIFQFSHIPPLLTLRLGDLCFEQQILALLLDFHHTHNLARSKFARAQSNQPIRALHSFNSQQIFLLWVKLITQGEKRETSAKNCNETMLHAKLRVFVSRISPPLSEDKR